MIIFQKLIFYLVCFFSISLSYPGYSQTIDFEVTVDRPRVSLGNSTQLNLTFHGTQDVSAPDLPDIVGFNWQYLGPSTRMSVVNGKVSSSITHIYTLLPLKVGKFEIPSFSLQ